MGWTKRQFILQAFEEIGIASYAFDVQPEQMQSALRRLDAMMADWNGKGIRLGYPIPLDPESSDLDDQSLVPDRANEAIITNLAVRIAPAYGATVSAETKAVAHNSYGTLLSVAAFPQEQQYPGTLPVGAGNKYWRSSHSPFSHQPEDPLLIGPDGPLELY